MTSQPGHGWTATGVVFFATFNFVLAIGITAPAYPAMLTATDAAGGDPIKGGSLWSLSVVLNGAFEFASAALLGELLDGFGRKPFMCLSLFGQTVDCAIASLSANDVAGGAVLRWHGWVLLGRSFAGCCGHCCRSTLGDGRE